VIGDPQRLQYLEAMGITTWASRYRFVNAKPTKHVEWQAAPMPEQPAPGQRLQALLEAPARPIEIDRGSSTAEMATTQEAPAPLSRARALLDGGAAEKASSAPAPSSRPATSSAPAGAVQPVDAAQSSIATLTEPLRFTLSLSIVGERWWLMLPGGRPLSSAGQALLGHMLKSVGIPADGAPLSSLTWPLMDVPASDPVDEAREGIQVFCAGQARRHGLVIDGAIVVGEEVWSPLLSDPANEVRWNCQHLPHPDDLLTSANAKRECWTLLQAAGRAWQQGRTSLE